MSKFSAFLPWALILLTMIGCSKGRGPIDATVPNNDDINDTASLPGPQTTPTPTPETGPTPYHGRWASEGNGASVITIAQSATTGIVGLSARYLDYVAVGTLYPVDAARETLTGIISQTNPEGCTTKFDVVYRKTTATILSQEIRGTDGTCGFSAGYTATGNWIKAN